ncbi:hypothetical protein Vadar_014404 [Vaccinium darrowii]|uniref:Uncharacterized protein n=1 Tax=Vaccinium darrowii TaxID=229202 RepID=A0ACB7ZKL3_9ERIC|nr:hypothetical protein Vadar_014404 [Vaccinium darrowii]
METESKKTDPMAPSSPPRMNWIRGRNICLVVIAVILGLVRLLVILGFTVFKTKRPVTTINSVALEDLNLSLNIAKVEAYLSVTNLSIKNPNKVGFKYTNSNIFRMKRPL